MTIAYRRRLIDAPSYTLNHEEVAKAFEEGVRFAECLAPEEVLVDAAGAAECPALPEVHDDRRRTGEMSRFPPARFWSPPARSPTPFSPAKTNTTSRSMAAISRPSTKTGNPVKPREISKPKAVYVLMSVRPDGRAISFFGDLHPSFSGNVVKAMGSAKQGYPVVSRMLSRICGRPQPAPAALIAQTRRRTAPRRA